MLVTLADMKAYLGIVSGTTYDTFLTQQITLISETIEAYCQRKFAETDYIQTFYREDLESMDRPLDEITCYHFPVSAVAAVLEKEAVEDAGTSVSDYRFHSGTGKVIKKRGTGRFFEIADIVEVQYTAGYATIPSPVTQVVYNLVQESYNKKINGIDLNFGSDVQSIAIPGVINIQYDFSLQNNDRKSTFGTILGSSANILDFYRSERAVIGTIRLAYVEEDA